MFHVPESSRILDGPMGSPPHAGAFGAFRLPSPEPAWTLYVIADDGTDAAVPESIGWEHVSVRAARGQQSRIPTWREMVFVKDQFWDADDVVMQLHPRRSHYVNQHPHVLHLWRNTTTPIPEPPATLVGAVPTARKTPTLSGAPVDE